MLLSAKIIANEITWITSSCLKECSKDLGLLKNGQDLFVHGYTGKTCCMEDNYFSGHIQYDVDNVKFCDDSRLLDTDA